MNANILKFITEHYGKLVERLNRIAIFFGKSPVARMIILFIMSRAALYIFAIIAFGIFTNRVMPIEATFIEQWWRWDSVHYINIANHGYVNFGEERFNIVFLPLYPVLISLVSSIGFHQLISGILVSNIASLLAVIYLYRLVKLDFNDNVAGKAVFFLLIFPTAYFLAAAYTEALFLALAIACFYYARTNKWILSGLLGLLAALTRSTGVIIFIALFAEYLWQKKFKLRNIKPDILALGLIPLGFGVYLLINHFTYGEYWHFLDVMKEYWHKYPSFPWENFAQAKNSIVWREPSEQIMMGLMENLFAALGFLASIFAFKIRFSYGIYSLLNWLLITSTSLWLSIPRYTLIIFPIFIIFALGSKNQIFNHMVTFVSMLLLGLFTVQFILGRWAF